MTSFHGSFYQTVLHELFRNSFFLRHPTGPIVLVTLIYFYSYLSVRMDAQFLKETVGMALIEALEKVLDKQPADPIEYLGLMLFQYIKNQECMPEGMKKRIPKGYQLPATDDGAKQSLALEKKIEGPSEIIPDEVDDTETIKKQFENGLEEKETTEENFTDKGEVAPIPESAKLPTAADTVAEEVDGNNTITHNLGENENTTSEEPALEVASAEINSHSGEAMDNAEGTEDGISHQDTTEPQSENQ